MAVNSIWFLLSTKGRIGRIGYCTYLSAIVGLFGSALLTVYVGDFVSNPGLTLGLRLVFIGLAAVGVIGLFVLIPVGVKRLHDRNKSGLWLAVFYVLPALLIVGDESARFDRSWQRTLALIVLLGWSVLELCCMPGSAGANHYGPDPVRPPTSELGPKPERLILSISSTAGINKYTPSLISLR
jgi:uncharacterized membrane protein YhaH (DUF805 family)